MTQEQLYGEIIAMIAKNQIEQSNHLDKSIREAQKNILDAAKELFINHDKIKARIYLAEAMSYLSDN